MFCVWVDVAAHNLSVPYILIANTSSVFRFMLFIDVLFLLVFCFWCEVQMDICPCKLVLKKCLRY